MRVKLQTSDVMLSNEDIFTSRVELLDAYNEVIAHGINLNYASALVDNMLVGLDIVQKYNSNKDATAALESLQKIVSKSPVEITASCEGVGEALKAAWDKFIEICKTVWQKIKNLFIKLKDWMLGTNKTNQAKTKQLKDRAKAAKPGKESLAAGLEGADGEASYISRMLPGTALKIDEGIQEVIKTNLLIVRNLKNAIFANGSYDAEDDAIEACHRSDALAALWGIRKFGRIDKIELLSHNLLVFKLDRENLLAKISTDSKEYGSRVLNDWNQSSILTALDSAEKIGGISEALQANKGLGELSNISLNADDITKLEHLTRNRRIDIPSMRDGSRVENDLKADRKMLFIAKCCVNAIRAVSTESAFMIAELPRIHAFINREVEKVMNALGY